MGVLSMELHDNFELDVVDSIKKQIETIRDPKEKFDMIASLQKRLNDVHKDLSHEYVYCSGCDLYVKRANRKVIKTTNFVKTYCHLCGKMHHKVLR